MTNKEVAGAIALISIVTIIAGELFGTLGDDNITRGLGHLAAAIGIAGVGAAAFVGSR